MQKDPELIESIKAVYDQFSETRYILLGSSQLLLLQKVKESLAGRCAIEELFPLTLPELRSKSIEDTAGYLPHEKFINVLSSMDINLYLAYSESWGNLITESLAFGVPCLATINSGVFDYDEFLKQKLVVMDYDNISAIKSQIDAVLIDYSNISKKSYQYPIILNKEADKIIEAFLN